MKDLYDIIIVGAGPAGLAAAQAAAGSGASICIIDDNPFAGGQIWRGGPQQQKDRRAQALWDAVSGAPNVRLMQGARVLYAPAPGELLVQCDGGVEQADAPNRACHPDAGGGKRAHAPNRACHLGGDLGAAQAVLRYQRLILATGARELLLPFPGWTLPGVTGAGGLQALVKGGYPVQDKRVVVAGSGPLLLAVGETLRARGAHVVTIVEQAPRATLAGFALGLLAAPSKLAQALQLARKLRGVPYQAGAWVRAAHGDKHLQQVELSDGRVIECDLLACGYGLLPNTELARSLGCAIDRDQRDGGQLGRVSVDRWLRTSVRAIYCAGEGTGVGGVDLALAEGRIAGLHASGQAGGARGIAASSAASSVSVGAIGAASREAQLAQKARLRWQRFASRLAQAFTLRPEIATLAQDDTIVCRCEDVTHHELKEHASWRSAKLHTRCGMGPCQGRICGAATATLYGWQPDSVRTPISPARAGSIIATAIVTEPEETSA